MRSPIPKVFVYMYVLTGTITCSDQNVSHVFEISTFQRILLRTRSKNGFMDRLSSLRAIPFVNWFGRGK